MPWGQGWGLGFPWRSQALRAARGRKIVWRILTMPGKNLRNSAPGDGPVKNPNK